MPRTSFLNVDLDVHASRPLTRLARALEALGAVTLHCGRLSSGKYRASFELPSNPRSADVAIRGLVRLIDALPSVPRKVWDSADLRDFNVGIQAEKAPFSFTSRLRPTTLALVTKLRGHVTYTVYAPRLTRSFSAQT
jgi:hypothetical protein